MLRGRAFTGRGYEPEAANFFWRNLEKSLYNAARITIYGASRKIGRPLQQLSDAWRLRVEDQGLDSKADGRIFTALLPSVGDAIPQLFHQKLLFGETLNPNDTVLDWLGDITGDVLHAERDSSRIDTDLLNQLSKYGDGKKHGLEDASFHRARSSNGVIHLNEDLAIKADELVQETPPARRTRIKGVLNQIAFLDHGAQLNLKSGSNLRILWEPENLEPLRDLWGQEVLAEGVLEYKPNGQPLILIADAIRLGVPQDSLWHELPEVAPLNRVMEPKASFRYDKNPLAKLRGIFDDMDEKTFLEMVEAIK